MTTDRFTALALCGLLVACGQAETPSAPPVPVGGDTPSPAAAVAYTCEGGKTVAVQYASAQADGRTTAVLTYEGQTHDMRTAEAASGARFVGSGLQWWTTRRDGFETGTLARLSQADGGVSAVLERCTRPLPPLPGAPPLVTVPVACRTTDLSLSAEGGDAGMGNRVVTLAAQNSGTAPCVLTGYPTVAVLDADGAPITSVRTEQAAGNYFRAGVTPTPVTLAPQGKAWFDLAWNVVPNEGAGQTACPQVASVRITPPRETASVTLDQVMTPCGGRVRVGPFRPTLEDVALEPPTAAVAPATATPRT